MSAHDAIRYDTETSDVYKALIAAEGAISASGIEPTLKHLVKLRASQINGCSYCVDMHSHEARVDGETEQRLYLVAAWRESPLFTERERAAFAWVEAVTRVADGGMPDALYRATLEHFTEADLVKLTVAVGIINIWNRLSVAFHALHPVRGTEA